MITTWATGAVRSLLADEAVTHVAASTARQMGTTSDRIGRIDGRYPEDVSGGGGAGASDARALSGCFDERAERRSGARRLATDHACERFDAAFVECRPDLRAQVVDRVLLRPRVAVDPLRDECVVDVADREDAGVEGELLASSGWL